MKLGPYVGFQGEMPVAIYFIKNDGGNFEAYDQSNELIVSEMSEDSKRGFRLFYLVDLTKSSSYCFILDGAKLYRTENPPRVLLSPPMFEGAPWPMAVDGKRVSHYGIESNKGFLSNSEIESLSSSFPEYVEENDTELRADRTIDMDEDSLVRQGYNSLLDIYQSVPRILQSINGPDGNSVIYYPDETQEKAIVMVLDAIWSNSELADAGAEDKIKLLEAILKELPMHSVAPNVDEKLRESANEFRRFLFVRTLDDLFDIHSNKRNFYQAGDGHPATILGIQIFIKRILQCMLKCLGSESYIGQVRVDNNYQCGQWGAFRRYSDFEAQYEVLDKPREGLIYTALSDETFKGYRKLFAYLLSEEVHYSLVNLSVDDLLDFQSRLNSLIHDIQSNKFQVYIEKLTASLPLKEGEDSVAAEQRMAACLIAEAENKCLRMRAVLASRCLDEDALSDQYKAYVDGSILCFQAMLVFYMDEDAYPLLSELCESESGVEYLISLIKSEEDLSIMINMIQGFSQEEQLTSFIDSLGVERLQALIGSAAKYKLILSHITDSSCRSVLINKLGVRFINQLFSHGENFEVMIDTFRGNVETLSSMLLDEELTEDELSECIYRYLVSFDLDWLQDKLRSAQNLRHLSYFMCNNSLNDLVAYLGVDYIASLCVDLGSLFHLVVSLYGTDHVAAVVGSDNAMAHIRILNSNVPQLEDFVTGVLVEEMNLGNQRLVLIFFSVLGAGNLSATVVGRMLRDFDIEVSESIYNALGLEYLIGLCRCSEDYALLYKARFKRDCEPIQLNEHVSMFEKLLLSLRLFSLDALRKQMHGSSRRFVQCSVVSPDQVVQYIRALVVYLRKELSGQPNSRVLLMSLHELLSPVDVTQVVSGNMVNLIKLIAGAGPLAEVAVKQLSGVPFFNDINGLASLLIGVNAAVSNHARVGCHLLSVVIQKVVNRSLLGSLKSNSEIYREMKMALEVKGIDASLINRLDDIIAKIPAKQERGDDAQAILPETKRSKVEVSARGLMEVGMMAAPVALTRATSGESVRCEV